MARTVTLATCVYDLAVLMVCSIALYTALLLVGLLVIGLEIWMALHPLSFGVVVALVLVPAVRAYRHRTSPVGVLANEEAVACSQPQNAVEREPDDRSPIRVREAKPSLSRLQGP